MQRWFFIDNKKHSRSPTSDLPVKTYLKSMEETKENDQDATCIRHFSVTVPDNIGCDEKVCISGNIPELGEWDYCKVVKLEKVDNTNIWSKKLNLPKKATILYRYVICSTSENHLLCIKQWETNINPRTINDEMNQIDIFGNYEGQQNTSKGWLCNQSVIQFKFINNPLHLKTRLSGHVMNIKVTPVKLSFTNEPVLEESLSTDTLDTQAAAGVTVEVSKLDNDSEVCLIKPQEQFGKDYKPNDILIINVTASNLSTLAHLVDFYSYSTRASFDDPPYHVGYTYILPNMLKQSEGALELPVTCNVKHRPLGTVNIEYLIIKPMTQKLCDLKVSHAKHWDPTWTGLEVGHRGLGASFKTKGGNSIRENTIASLKKAASSGADMLEFDVQLSKDMIPVIYHDFHVCISMKKKKEVYCSEMLELPVKDLTLEHLQKLKVYHLVEGRNHETIFDDEDLEEHQPFPTLENVLKEIDFHVGFNVELKWTMELNDGTFELNNPFDMNTYVDKVLEVVLKNAGERRIVFSCFNPDICTMVRFKQNKYPVMFLTVGITKKYPPYRDPRCLSIPAAVQYAISADILGIVVHTEDLLRDPTQVKLVTNAGLVIFCWGDDNNDKNTIKKLKEMGLHAVIYDKLDEYTTKEIKESIFLVGARESQREMMQLAALEEQSVGSASETESVREKPRYELKLREALLAQGQSTVTSLQSLASTIEMDDPCKKLKRHSDIINAIEKETQLKKPPANSFLGLFPAGDSSKTSTKRLRKNK